MEIIEYNEAFKLLGDNLSFRCVKGIVSVNHVLYAAEWDDRFNLPRDTSQLRIIQEIKSEDRGPPIEEGWTVIAPQQHEHPYHVKKPGLHAFYEASDLQGQIKREVETCELLKIHPHPNICSYFGCTELRGRVSGLCFKKYQQTLLDRVNPKGLNKTMFVDSEDRRLYVDESFREKAAGQLLAAIEHLHSLNIIHNDITPANIMLDEKGTIVLIDFDSCRRQGEPLGGVKRTYGWYNPLVATAVKENDLDAFREIQIWLFGDSADLYQFK